MEDSSEETANFLKSGEEAHIQAHVELHADLRKMVNETACSDVAFVCKDGERVEACRVLLVSRSIMLKSMLMNGMAETKASEIQLPEISSRVLLSVFEFLYTGSMLDYPLLGWRMAFEVWSAARFFILPTLEKIVRKFLFNQTFAVSEDLPKPALAALMLTEAMEFKSLCEERDVILSELVKLLSPKLQPIYVHGLSEDALHYLLANTRSICEDDGKISFKEYLRLRQVLLWWICQYCQGDPEELLSFIVPDEEIALCLFKEPYTGNIVQSTLEDGSSHSQHFCNALLDKTKRGIVVNLLSKIDLRCIPPILLVKVVKPLKIICEGELSKAFQHHALRKPIVLGLPKVGWELGSSYVTIADQGSTICNNGNRTGFAVASVPMSRPYGVYLWYFKIEGTPDTFCELGFISTVPDFPVRNLEFQERLSDQRDARVVKVKQPTSPYHREYASINWQGDGRPNEWKGLGKELTTGSIVMFHYNASERNCSLFIDGQDFGVAWRNLPPGIYFPAVSFGLSRGRIHIKLISGFETF